MVLLTTLAVIAAVAVSAFLLRSRRARAPAVVRPVLGILNLDADRFGPLASEDRAALAPLFSSVVESNRVPPECDVLLLYGSIGPQGQIDRSPVGLREIIRDAGAKVVVVAAENEAERYIEAAQPAPYGKANLVMTLERRGDAFPTFFRQLFGRMFSGTSMPVAWVELAPQIPGHEHSGCPETIFACELGQLTFRGA